MITKFKKNIIDQNLFNLKKHQLLALSGGLDSTVLFHLLIHLKIKFSVAHVNYKLRGKESDDDEKFVEKLCSKHQIQLFIKRIEDPKEKEFLVKNIQTNARKIRYEWFEKLKNENHFDCLLTAHHALDQVETILFNQIRGTGIKGYLGMNPINGYIVRPLLNITKYEIISYSKKNKIKFRIDQSNLSNEYTRNKIRNLILPEISKINTNFEKTFNDNSIKLNEFYEFALENFNLNKENWTISENGLEKIYFQKFNSKFKYLYYYFIFKKIGISIDQAIELVKFEKSKTGSIVKIGSNVIHKRSNYLECYKKDTCIINEPIKKNQKTIIIGEKIIQLDWIKVNKMTDYLNISKNDSFSLYIDVSKAKKMKLRTWEKGDKMKPLGSNFYKKLSDIFINKKFNQREKENVLIIEIDNEISGFIPNTISENFKITDQTNLILRIGLN